MSVETAVRGTEIEQRIRAVTPPVPVLDRDREARLTDRQRQILDDLVDLFDGGFADLTMAEIASRVNCSLRTLYELAPSRDELVLAVVDRNLWRIGRTAMTALGAETEPLEAIRSYLRAANVAVAGTTEAFATDLAAVPAAQRLSDEHSDYLVEVTRCLLDLAVERGDVEVVDTRALARVMAGLGRDLSRPHVIPRLATSPKAAADEVVDVLLRGLRRTR